MEASTNKRGFRRKNIKERSIRLIAIRPRSVRELRDRLAMEGFKREEIEETINELKGKGYLDDKGLAEMLFRSLSERKCYGSIRIRRELRKRGIEEEVISDVMGYHGSDEEELERAIMMLNKYLKGSRMEEDPIRARARIFRYMIGKGFPQDMVQHILREHCPDESIWREG